MTDEELRTLCEPLSKMDPASIDHELYDTRGVVIQTLAREFLARLNRLAAAERLAQLREVQLSKAQGLLEKHGIAYSLR